MPTYAVTGASGHFGRLTVHELLVRGVPASDVAAVVRTRGKAADLADLGVLNADNTTSPLAAEHQDTERALWEADTENYTGQIGQYLQAGEILGAVGHGRISAASRQDYAAAAAMALREDKGGNRTYELGGSAFGLPELAQIITEVTGTKVTYRDLPAEAHASWLQQAGLAEATAHFRGRSRCLHRPRRPRDQ